jgi:hypothetical protein
MSVLPSPPMTAALNLDPLPEDPAVAERRAQLLALPLREEPETDEERALFDRAAAEIQAGRGRGRSPREIHAFLEQMGRDQAE